MDLMNDYGNENWLQQVRSASDSVPCGEREGSRTALPLQVINEGTAHNAFEAVNRELMHAVQELELDIMIEATRALVQATLSLASILARKSLSLRCAPLAVDNSP